MKTPTMFYVVSRALAQQMRGERVQSKAGKVYGIFSTLERAEAYRGERKLILASEIVEQ